MSHQYLVPVGTDCHLQAFQGDEYWRGLVEAAALSPTRVFHVGVKFNFEEPEKFRDSVCRISPGRPKAKQVSDRRHGDALCDKS